MQAQDVIANALRWLGVLAVGETASSQELSDGLVVLNELVASLSAEEIYLYTRAVDALTATATTGSYTWGTGGAINSTRPLRLVKADCSFGGTTVPVDIIGFAAWSNIPERAVQGNVVQRAFLDNAYPLATLNLWPVPKTTSTTLSLYSLKALTAFAATTDTFDFPPGYERAIRLNLALDLAPEYGIALTATHVSLAEQAKRALRSLNKQNFAGLDGADSGLVSTNDAPPPAPAPGPQGAA